MKRIAKVLLGSILTGVVGAAAPAQSEPKASSLCNTVDGSIEPGDPAAGGQTPGAPDAMRNPLQNPLGGPATHRTPAPPLVPTPMNPDLPLD